MLTFACFGYTVNPVALQCSGWWAMIATYKARLHGNRLDWQEEPPPASVVDLSVLVTVLPNDDAASQPHIPSGRKLATILRGLARENAFPSIPDPIAWQREISFVEVLGFPRLNDTERQGKP